MEETKVTISQINLVKFAHSVTIDLLEISHDHVSDKEKHLQLVNLFMCTFDQNINHYFPLYIDLKVSNDELNKKLKETKITITDINLVKFRHDVIDDLLRGAHDYVPDKENHIALVDLFIHKFDQNIKSYFPEFDFDKIIHELNILNDKEILK